jgi:hypothetical protein
MAFATPLEQLSPGASDPSGMLLNHLRICFLRFGSHFRTSCKALLIETPLPCCRSNEIEDGRQPYW